MGRPDAALIRPATADDREQLLDLVDEFVDFFHDLRGDQRVRSDALRDKQRRLFDSMLADEDVQVFVVQQDEKLVAFADVLFLPILQLGEKEAKIEDFFVTADVRGSGIGTALLEAIKAACRDRGVGAITLTSGHDLVPAHAFYERHGGEFAERMYRFDL